MGGFILKELDCLRFIFSFANSLSEEKVRTFKEMFQMFDKECVGCFVVVSSVSLML